MNNLSQECIEQIEKASANYLYPATFMAGGKTALLTPTIYQSANLMTVEEALMFAEWVDSCAYLIAPNNWGIHGKVMDGAFYTTTELLTIFRNQNQEG